MERGCVVICRRFSRQDFGVRDVLEGPHMMQVFKPDLIKSILSSLVPPNIRWAHGRLYSLQPHAAWPGPVRLDPARPGSACLGSARPSSVTH